MKSLQKIIDLLRKDEGATAVEYAIMASLIAAVIAGSVALFGTSVLGLFNKALDNWPK